MAMAIKITVLIVKRMVIGKCRVETEGLLD